MQSVAEVLNFYNMVNRSIPGPKSYRKLPGFEPGICRKVYYSCALQLCYIPAGPSPGLQNFYCNFPSVWKTLIIRAFKIPRIVEVGQIGFHERKKRFWFGYILRIGRISIWKKSSYYGFLKMVFYYAIIENWQT